MSKILMPGVGPLPIENTQRLYAPGLRTWSFALHLARKGHTVYCATADFGGQEYSDSDLESCKTSEGEVIFIKLTLNLKQIIKQA